jgi:hypothetical protein
VRGVSAAAARRVPALARRDADGRTHPDNMTAGALILPTVTRLTQRKPRGCRPAWPVYRFTVTLLVKELKEVSRPWLSP